MARCPHCNLVLSADELRGDACPVCRGQLNDSAGATRSGGASAPISASQAQSTSSHASPGSASSGSTAPASAGSSTAGATSKVSLRTVGLLAPVALWLVLAIVWISGGSAFATPPRILGLALLGVPLFVAVLGATGSSKGDEDE